MSTPTILHLKTQRNQPYGSVRRCCEECGTMIWGNVPIKDGGRYTDEPQLYESPPEGYVRCRDRGKQE
jgi:hypothetical protein